MLKCVAGAEKLRGKTIVLVDVSGSMTASLSQRSEMRTDAVYGLACCCARSARRSGYSASPTSWSRFRRARGFALRDAIDASQPHSNTMLGKAVGELNQKLGYDRLIVITDEQAHDTVPAPRGKGYVINVASYKNGVGYRKWTHVDGWSESVVEYIRELERAAE
jgi:hypothetical protein